MWATVYCVGIMYLFLWITAVCLEQYLQLTTRQEIWIKIKRSDQIYFVNINTNTRTTNVTDNYNNSTSSNNSNHYNK